MRKTPLQRKTALRSDPAKTLEWKKRSQKRLPQESTKRKHETKVYHSERQQFLESHPVCPVTGERTTQIHHSCHREGGWLNLQRYWIAVSAKGHEIIEGNKNWTFSVGLCVHVNAVFRDHLAALNADGLSLDIPLFYLTWDHKLLSPT